MFQGGCESQGIADSAEIFEQCLDAECRDVLDHVDKQRRRTILILNKRFADAGLIGEIFRGISEDGGDSFRPFYGFDKRFWRNREERFLRASGDHFVRIVCQHGENFGELPMSTYSSGMSARLRFSIAAAKLHEVLLVDEALATGDAEFRRKSEHRIHELRDEAGTVFLVSHSLDVVTQTCNRAIWLDKGLIRMDADAKSVVKAYTDATS